MTGNDDDLAREAEADVRSYVAGYCRALWKYVTQGARIDYDALGFWKFPLMMISGTGEACSVNIYDEAAFDAMVRPGYEYYYGDGWDGRVEVHSAEATIVGASFAVVETTGSRYRADDSVNSSWSCLYLLQRDGIGWKHIGVDSALPPRSVANWSRWLSSLASTTGS
jgi:hypothetical protein